jgi:BASS family bile acid:Na+ symporter
MVLGLAIKNVPDWIRHFTVPALAIVMVVSLTQISLRSFMDIKAIARPILYSILFNYIIFGALMLIMARFLIDDRDFWIGFVILAVAPPGVAVAPFTYIIGGNEKFSIIGVIGAYIAALAIIPIAGILFIGKSFAQPLNIIIVFIELIIVPLIISQLLIKFKLDKYIKRWRGPVVNWGLFIVIFAVISLNRDVFFKDFKTLGLISLVAAVTIFGLWLVIGFVLKKLRFKEDIRKSLILIGTVKNSGFAAATALTLFGVRASLPGAIFSVFLIIFLLIIPLAFKRNKSK